MWARHISVWNGLKIETFSHIPKTHHSSFLILTQSLALVMTLKRRKHLQEWCIKIKVIGYDAFGKEIKLKIVHLFGVEKHKHSKRIVILFVEDYHFLYDEIPVFV